MDKSCKNCRKLAGYSCSCNNSLFFCLNDYIQHELLPDEHSKISLSEKRNELIQQYDEIMEKITKIKMQVINKSKHLIDIIITSTQKQFLELQQLSNQFYSNIIEKTHSKAYDLLEEYRKIQFQGDDSSNFTEIIKKYFGFSIQTQGNQPPSLDITSLQELTLNPDLEETNNGEHEETQDLKINSDKNETQDLKN